ncbi:MAG: copper chaperone PCu(A)C, partial [Acetobacteraceae bacterium]|nr:copper chaperone PCu(A)C [Acetobacteraceae bacterium]
VMRMRAVEVIEVPAGQTVTLRPGGLHLMLIGLALPLREGETVPVTLRFERAGVVPVELSVQAAGAREPAPHRH